jgi:hypothetical protein|nr:MAG TPA: PLP-dependent enzyme [Crassvirales sp.]
MKDKLGREVEVGDRVVFIPNHYKELREGEIIFITECRVKIKEDNSLYARTYIKSSDQFVKITPEV